jgi:hypothetical protein
VPASFEAGTLKLIKLYHQTLTLHHYCDYGFINRKKPTLLDGSMGLVMNVEETPLML